MKKSAAVFMAAVFVGTMVLSGCGNKEGAAEHVAALIDAIYTQERTDTTDAQCEEAKKAWDRLTEEQKKLVAGEFADPDYFGKNTGDA